MKGNQELWCRLVGIKADFTIGVRYGQVCFFDGSGELRVPLPLLDGYLGLFGIDLDSDPCWTALLLDLPSSGHRGKVLRKSLTMRLLKLPRVS